MVSRCHISSCFYCLNVVPNAYMNVPLGWKMHLAWFRISAPFSQLGSVLLDEMPFFPALVRNLEQTMDGECDADFGLKQNHSCANPTCTFGEISFFCSHESPSPAPARHHHPRKKTGLGQSWSLMGTITQSCEARNVPMRL